MSDISCIFIFPRRLRQAFGGRRTSDLGLRFMKLLLPFLLFCLFGHEDKKTTIELKAYKDTTVTNFFRRESGLIAADNAISVPLSNGKVFWNFGDSYIDTYQPATGTVPCLFQVRNAAIVQPYDDWNWTHSQTLIGTNTTGVKSLFKNSTDEKYFMWPGAGFQHKDTMYMYCTSLVQFGNGAFDFKQHGNDLWAKVTVPGMKVVKYTSLPAFDTINFGCGYVKDEGSDMMYAFGYKPDFIESNVFVARFSLKDPNTNWTFWNGQRWDKEVKHAKPITRGASNSVYVCKVRNKYVLVTSEFSVACDMGKKIYVATSDHPTGPFTQRKEIYSIDDREQGHSPFFYSVFPHPEYINEKNELLITYCINGYEKCVPFCKDGKANPDYYRAKAIRVPLEVIDEGLK
jgi:hypothetical protein